MQTKAKWATATAMLFALAGAAGSIYHGDYQLAVNCVLAAVWAFLAATWAAEREDTND